MTALWLRTTLRKQLLGHPRAMPGVWGRFASHRILPRKEFMGRAFESAPCSMPLAGPSGLLQAKGVRKCLLFNAPRWRFRLVASEGRSKMPLVQCPSLALQACCKRRAFENASRSMPFACASGLLQAKGVRKCHLVQCPPHELFPWEYAMTRKPPPNPRHCSWMPEELFP